MSHISAVGYRTLPSALFIEEMRGTTHTCHYLFYRKANGAIADMCAYALVYTSDEGDWLGTIDYQGAITKVNRP